MRKVAIFGVGLIGGSFGLALRKWGFDGDIVGVSSPRAIAAAVNRGVISSGMNLREAAQWADLIYLAQPVGRILQTIEQLQPLISSDCLVTDAGSTKTQIVKKAAKSLAAHQFLGGHPLTGKEQRGVEAADGALFQQRPYVLTPTGPETHNTAIFRCWLARLGAEVIDMSPEEHDTTVAFTSHLPQLLSTALARTLAVQNNTKVDAVFGQGLLDMTRLALSPADLWSSILATNKDAIDSALDAFSRTLAELRNSIGTEDLDSLFTSANLFSNKIRKADCTN
jgi:prephenate dehydrogenase